MPRTLVLAASLLLAYPPGGALAQAPSQAEGLGRALSVIDECVARLDAEVDVGFRRIVLRCPDLAAALERGGLERWLPRDWRDPDNNLSAGGLEELRQLLASELTMRALSRPPSVERLRLALADLGAPARSGTLWGELERWLRRLGGHREPAKTAEGLSMLDRIGLAPVATRVIAFAALAGLLAIAAVILLNELRVARVLRVPSPRRRGAAVQLVRTSAAEVGEVSASERPRVLLAKILERLSRARGLTGLGSLTTRELIRAVPFDDAEAASHLAQLALTAERVRYAARPATAGDLDAAVHGGSALLEKLST
jgi:hypothetical protein